MGKRETYRDTMAYAVALAGSERLLAQALKVTTPQLENWLRGVDEVPDCVFLAAVDMIIASPRESIARAREILTRYAKASLP